jgi:hypothetical protein
MKCDCDTLVIGFGTEVGLSVLDLEIGILSVASGAAHVAWICHVGILNPTWILCSAVLACSGIRLRILVSIPNLKLSCDTPATPLRHP